MTIYPSLRYHDARAGIDFLVKALGFTETEAHADGDGVIQHAELSGFGGMIMLGTEPAGGDPRWGEHAGQSWLYLSTDDPDALHGRAVTAGRTSSWSSETPTTARATSPSAIPRATSGGSGRTRRSG